MKANISTYPTALRLLAALFFFLLFTPPAAGQGGDGTVSKIENKDGGNGLTIGSPILIATAAELAYFSKQVNDGGKKLSYGTDGEIDKSEDNSYKGGFSGYYFALSADIDLAGIEWTPIGTYGKPFRGHFDGKGHVVMGLKVDMSNGSDVIYAGLFGCVYNGTIQNLGVELSDEGIKAGSDGSVYAGGIVGKITGSGGAATIRNCYVTGSGTVKITGKSNQGFFYAGGIAGYVNKADGADTQSVTLTHCYATVNVEGGITGTGGIVGQLDRGTLSFTYATGTVTGGSGITGGICGKSSGGSLTNNLALNEKISNGSSSSGRVLGENFVSSSPTTLIFNYAKPDMSVNGNPVTSDIGADKNAGASLYSENLKTTLVGASGSETEWNDAWEWPDDGSTFPQLKMVTEDENGNLSYGNNWPSGSQTVIKVTDYLPTVIWDGLQSIPFSSGDGSKATPYQISSGAELAYLAQQVNKSNSSIRDKYFELSADIDLAGNNWTPIGTGSFRGHFDGKGHVVKGLTMKISNDDNTDDIYAGLFGSVIGGTIQNLGVELADAGIEVSATNAFVDVGGIVGQMSGSRSILRNCYVTGKGAVKIPGAYGGFAGGIIGYCKAESFLLTHCYATIDVEAIAIATSLAKIRAGGIVGNVGRFGEDVGEISYTYATGNVKVSGSNRDAGGIVGFVSASASVSTSNNLSLNGNITCESGGNRSVGYAGSSPSVSNNYASTRTKINGSPINSNDPSSWQGANTWLYTFEDDLKKEPAGNANGWNTAWTWAKGKLPQLKMIIAEDDNGDPTGYGDWTSDAQPSISVSDYLIDKVTLHIVPVEGGHLRVFDPVVGQYLFDREAVTPDITLSLEYAAANNYRFDGFFYGLTADDVTTPVSGTTIPMPAADLWLRARFTYEAPEPEPEPTVYYTVTLPEVEGATTDPVAGSYEVEAWSTFRFYLTTDTAYSESQPVVTTDRGETLTPRSSDGAYLVKYVRSDVEVFIDGLFPNNPVANESITDPHAASDSALPRIWTEPSALCILLPDGFSATPVRILSPDGRLLDAFQAAPGLSRRQQLPTGIYIVWIGDTVRKVVVRD